MIPEYHLYQQVLEYLEEAGGERCIYTMGRTLLSRLSRLLPYDMGYFILFDPQGRVNYCATEHVDERSKRQYFDYYIKIDPCRLTTPLSARRFCTDWSRYRETEFYADFGSREHVDFSAGLQFHGPGGGLLSILFITRSGTEGFHLRELHLLDLLHPHLENLLVLAAEAVALVPVSGDIPEDSAPPKALSVDAGPLALLTPRERQIVTLISRGVTTKEIGSSLLIRPSTVYRHISNIFEKTGTSSRPELLALVAGAHLSPSRG